MGDSRNCTDSKVESDKTCNQNELSQELPANEKVYSSHGNEVNVDELENTIDVEQQFSFCQQKANQDKASIPDK